MAAPQPVAQNYTQPPLPARIKAWSVNSIDYQVVTKDNNWNQDQTKRLNEYQEAVNLGGVTHVALGVPYDNTTKYANYVADARTKGFKIWFRSHWNEWEGDNGADPILGRQDYLDQTYDFIVDHPTYFEDGDIFTVCVECNNANDNGNYTFRVPETSEGVFNMTKYNQFLKDQVTYANAAFLVIGKSVTTNFLSMSLSLIGNTGFVLDSGTDGRAGGFTDQDCVDYLNGIITIDHYLSDDYRVGDDYAGKYSNDLDQLHQYFPSCQFMIGEWGYHTTTSVSDMEQYCVFQSMVSVLRSKSFIVGVNFWVEMASNTASMWADTGGNIIKGGRQCIKTVKNAFNSGNSAYGARVQP